MYCVGWTRQDGRRTTYPMVNGHGTRFPQRAVFRDRSGQCRCRVTFFRQRCLSVRAACGFRLQFRSRHHPGETASGCRCPARLRLATFARWVCGLDRGGMFARKTAALPQQGSPAVTRMAGWTTASGPRSTRPMPALSNCVDGDHRLPPHTATILTTSPTPNGTLP